ncbi:hypothetical protein Kpol_1001p25 [Vanderwaltozyma polyspora DSM 70294]|uniref:CNH domain-containing protein n=1 Tax=Vanderwaltozyma polyspora (strain ATCC 22028 / DSM 70294 / BCRC 21397 / CBS 2163 / NBRC 10782 / NRRL Y-8283 / UCD 57-17) TaxID=436907 RepID=A7TNR2_VANPO|nr:uncharacterized protein Kpol_1001p25 [Vanderwaltozyma polyspora DSM 70294]EDO16113.1 hypothetical protein Kpol_1001p25 [Vanderwaltozyma polyspora DSM 70294]
MSSYNYPKTSSQGQYKRPNLVSNRENVDLPKLPPLRTKSSFLENRDNSEDNISIGWTPVIGNNGVGGSEPNSTGSLSNIGNVNNSDSPISGSRRSISGRPPPPRIPTQYSIPSSPLRIAPTRTKTSTPTSSQYKSPFVSESDSNLLRKSTNNSSKIYRSPFIGDDEIKSRSSSPRIWSTPPEEFEQSTKSIPGLSSYNDNILDSPTFFERPPLPKIPSSSSRNMSGNSKVSDSIESCYSDSNYTFNNSNARHSSFNSLLGGKPLELAPSITAPTQPFSINSLDENKLYQCYSVYKLSDIYEWVLKVYFEWFNEYVFGKFEFFQMIQLLLEFQMPKAFDQDTIDSNVDKIIESLVLQKAVRFEKESDEDEENENEITIIVAGLDICGIFTELLPCYSFSDNTYSPTLATVCYSETCLNRLPTESRQELKLSEIINKSVGLWTDYWKLTPEMLAEINPREIQRQSFIFDLIILEERSLNMANAALEVYGKNFDPNLLPDEPNFASLAFNVFPPLIQLHKEFLLTPIFWKLKTRGKFIDSIGKIYLKWVNEAREIYINYATAMATVHEIITWEKQHNTKFAQWLAEVDNLPDITRSKMYHDVIFFGGFFKSLQNLPLTLQSILKNTDPSMEDYEYLEIVIKEVESLSAEVDRVHGAAIDRRKLVRFSKQLVFNSKNNYTVGYVNIKDSVEDDDGTSSQDKLDLGLTDTGRKLLMAGTIMKKRELWLEPTPVYIALLDNYFLITERVMKGNQERYKLIERPIPIEYLNLEQRKPSNEDGRSSAGGSIRESIYKGSNKSASQLVSTPISAVRPHLINAASTVSKSLYSSPTHGTNKENSHTEISNAIPSHSEFGFKVRNLATNESFTFYSSSFEEREQWRKAFIACFDICKKQTVTPVFNVQVISTQFAYSEKDAPVNLPVTTEGSEIDIALKKYETENNRALQNVRIMPAMISCSISIEYEAKTYFFVATEFGIFMRCESESSKKFVKVINCVYVKKMESNVKLGLIFVLDNRKLCYYNIPSLLGAYYSPQKYLSNNRVIGILVKDKISTFKFAEDFGNSKHLLYERKGKIVVLTPEFDRLTKSLKFFKFYKEYSLPNFGATLTAPDVHDIIVFKKCFIACTTKGSIVYQDAFNDDGIVLPTFFNDTDMSSYLKQSHISHYAFKTNIESSSKKDSSKQKMAEYVKKDIASNKTKPISCFHLDDSLKYVMVYDEAAVMINKYGDIENWKHDILVLDFYCTGVSLIMGYLILVGDNLVQIYDLNTDTPLGRLVPVQIIKGKKIRLISSKNIDEAIISLSHPNIANRQLLLACKPRDL